MSAIISAVYITHRHTRDAFMYTHVTLSRLTRQHTHTNTHSHKHFKGTAREMYCHIGKLKANSLRSMN